MKGWYGDSTRHSLASRGIRTTDQRQFIQYRQEPSCELINGLENEMQSVCANGILKKAKTKVKKTVKKAKEGIQTVKDKTVKKAKDTREEFQDSFKKENIKKDFKEKKEAVKKTGSILKETGAVIGNLALLGTQELIKMGKEMADSGSLFFDIPEDETAMKPEIKVALKNEIIKIDADIKTIDKRINEKRKEISEEERQDRKDFNEWYEAEKDAYKQVKEGIQGSGMNERDMKYELRKEEIEFKARVEKNKHLLRSFEESNDADIEYLRDFKNDLKRLRNEINKRVNAG